MTTICEFCGGAPATIFGRQSDDESIAFAQCDDCAMFNAEDYPEGFVSPPRISEAEYLTYKLKEQL